MPDVQVCHDAIDSDLHRVIIAPVVVEHSQGFAEVDV